MYRKWVGSLLMAAAISVFAVLANAQVIEDPTRSCQFTFSGGGVFGLNWCMTQNGTIWKMASDGAEHIFAGTPIEGYALCDWRTDQTYYDYGGNNASGFGQIQIVSGCLNGNLPCTMQRTTNDGKFRLRMVYSHNVAEREISINATVFNLQNVQTDTIDLWRFADADMESTPFNSDVADKSFRSTWAREFNRMSLTALTRLSDAVPFTYITGASPPSTPLCSDSIGTQDKEPLPVSNQDIGLLTGYQFQSGIKPLKNKTVKFQYRLD